MNNNILIDSYSLTEDNLTDYLNNIGKIPLLTAQEEIEIGKKIYLGNKDAIDDLIVHNLRLVVAISKHYLGFGLPLIDLIEEGNIGLIEAANRFDVTKGYRFSTYATKWITQKIEIGITNTSRNIRIPYHKFEKIIKYKKVKEKLSISLNRIPTKEEIANEMNESPDNIDLYESIINDTISLNYQLNDDDKQEFGDLISNERSLEDELIKNELPFIIKDIFEELALDETEIDILTKRYGLDGLGNRTFEEISSKYHKTRTWACQKEEKVLTKIKKSKIFKETFN